MKYCAACNKNFSEEDNFCDECSSKLKEKEKENKKEKKQEEKNIGHKEIKVNWLKFIIISITILLLVGAILIFIIPLPYNSVESYTQNDPHQEESCKNISFSYEVTNIEHLRSGGLCTATDGTTSDGQCSTWTDITIRNKDTEAGNFKIECTNSRGESEVTNQGSPVPSPDFWIGNPKIEPGSESKFSCVFTYPVGETLYFRGYKVLPPSREMCNINTVYAEVNKERPITKYATLFQRWTGRVN